MVHGSLKKSWQKVGNGGGDGDDKKSSRQDKIYEVLKYFCTQCKQGASRHGEKCKSWSCQKFSPRLGLARGGLGVGLESLSLDWETLGLGLRVGTGSLLRLEF
jgi:hypothetical protein